MKKTTLTTILLLSALLLTGCNSNNNAETTTTANINVAEDKYITEAAETTADTTEVITTEEPRVSDSDVPFMEFDSAYTATVEKNVSDNVTITLHYVPIESIGRLEYNKPEPAIIPFNKNTTYKDISTIQNYELITTEELFTIECNDEVSVGYDKENKKEIKADFDIKYEGISVQLKNFNTFPNIDNEQKEIKPILSVEAYNEKGIITNPSELNEQARIKAISVNANVENNKGQRTYILPTITFTAEDGKECSFTIGGSWNIDKELEKAGICDNWKDVRFKLDYFNDYVVVKNTDYTVIFAMNANEYINSITLINN